MAEINVNTPTYVATPTSASGYVQLSGGDAQFSNLTISNSSTQNVFVATSAAAPSTLVYPTTYSAMGTVIPAGATINLVKNLGDLYVNFIQPATGSGNIYITPGVGDLTGFGGGSSSSGGTNISQVGGNAVGSTLPVSNVPSSAGQLSTGGISAASYVTLKSSAGSIFSVYGCNRNASSPRYLQIYAQATGAPTGTPIIPGFLIPFGGTPLIVDQAFFGTNGIAVATGITIAISTTENSYTAPTASECGMSGVYQ